MSEGPHTLEGGHGGPHTARSRPRWPGAASLFVIGVVYAVLREDLRVAPAFLLLVLLGVLLVPSLYAQLRGRHHLSHLLGLALVGLATIAVGTSVFLLVVVLSTQPITPLTALRDAGLIWLANVLSFAVWYLEIDEGGPGRRRSDAHEGEDSQFPQDQDGASGWSPDFADYLFLAFNQSTAFGPTDTSVMSKRAKILSMTQALFSLLIIAVVVARATAQ
jgi:Protein of unknown function (DUF1345)